MRAQTPDREREALRILGAAGGEHVHLHAVSIDWGADDVPFAHFNPDPFLESGPEYD
ncbi:MAG: hypothetical protein Kow0026_12570 [Oricola sp.]